MDLPQSTKRAVKAWRNAVVDPLPRRHALTLAQLRVRGERIEFMFRAKGNTYLVTVSLPPVLGEVLQASRSAAMDQLLTAIGVSFSPFFFKLSDFAELAVETAPLDEESRLFFERFLVGGLGEFRYLQGLDPTRPIRVAARSGEAITPIRYDTTDHLLLLNGGGKDTVVAAELLKASKQPFSWVTLLPNDTRRKVVKLSGVFDSVDVGYEIDDEIERRKAYPWGHIPRTSIVLAIGLLVAVLTRSRYVAAGNELSANFGNLIHRGVEINHQYTKSFAFERGFWQFAQRRVTSSTRVFSILRPFHELQLSQLFAGQKPYLENFISCNRGIGLGRWCKQCPKCAFTALALRPFAQPQDLFAIFGEDVLQRVEIRKHILDLVSGKTKPWECVGTTDECRLALALVLRQTPDMDFACYPRRKDFERHLEAIDICALRTKVLSCTGQDHLIPKELLHRLDVGLRKMSNDRLSFEPSQSGQAAR